MHDQLMIVSLRFEKSFVSRRDASEFTIRLVHVPKSSKAQEENVQVHAQFVISFVLS